jgi:8-oxo-dGTP diphosphatase
MKLRGASIIFLNDRNEVLLFLRDNFPSIECPNMWDLPGGKIEDDETPEACIVREMREEIDIDLAGFQLFERYEFPDRTEFTFWKRENLDVERLVLTEGQALRWFSRKEIEDTTLAFGFNRTVETFYRKILKTPQNG